MAVPTTSSGWSLATVRIELGLGTTTSLAACVTEGNVQDGWDATYSGSKNSLLNFRGYSAVPPETLSISPTGYNAGSGSGSITATVTSNTTWATSSGASWLTYSGNSNTGDDTFTVSFQSNGTGNLRVASITLTGAGKTVTLTVQQTG